MGVVNAEFGATAYEGGLGEVGVGGVEADAVVGAGLHGPTHRVDEARRAVGVDGVVAAVVGHQHTLQATAFGQPAGHAEHDAVAEGDHRGAHILLGIVARGDGVGAGGERRGEVAPHEGEVDHQVLDAEALAVPFGAGLLAGGMVVAIAEGDGQGDAVVLLVEEGGGVEPTGVDEDGVFDGHGSCFVKGGCASTPVKGEIRGAKVRKKCDIRKCMSHSVATQCIIAPRVRPESNGHPTFCYHSGRSPCGCSGSFRSRRQR